VLKPSAFCLLLTLLSVVASAQVEVLSNGNVGIGTSGPNYSLTIYNPTIPRLQLTNSDTGQNSTDGFLAYMNGTDAVLLNREPGNLFLATDNTHRVTIDPTGNVGIGTSTPQAKLEVNGTSKFDSTVWFAVDGATLFHTAKDGGATGGIVAEAGKGLYLGANNSLSTGIFINGSGNVGLGTTNPTSGRLQVEGGDIALGADGSDRRLLIWSNTEGADAILIRRSDNSSPVSIATSAYGKNLLFKVGGSEIVRFRNDGNVGIGTANPGYKLEVAGSVRATSFISNTTTYADFVFAPDYDLPALSEVEAHIAEHGHLPGIPSEAEARAHGIDLAAMQVKLLQKIEEITLHQIQQAKDIAVLKAENARLQRQLSTRSLHP
jgi:hypothetical protein